MQRTNPLCAKLEWSLRRNGKLSLHADAIKIRATVGGAGIGVARCAGLAGDVALNSFKGRQAGEIGRTLKEIGAIGYALPRYRDAGSIICWRRR